MDLDIPDLKPETIGTFDIVLFCGVFYHLRYPFLTLTQIARLAKRTLIVETHLDAWETNRPAMIFYPAAEQDKDPSNWWGPNPACVEAMLRDVGFPHVTSQPNPAAMGRGIFHARRQVPVTTSRPSALLFGGWAWRRARGMLRRFRTRVRTKRN
jgi:tRNA (mo5U34)-methyltransferase